MLLKGHFNPNCIQITQMAVYDYIFNMHIKHFINKYTAIKILYGCVFSSCPQHLLVSARVIH